MNETNEGGGLNESYGDHVIMFSLPGEEAAAWDSLVAFLLVVCTFVGVPANLLSVVYFRSLKKRELATSLYVVISAVDCCVAATHLPVPISLFNNRKPELFQSLVVCTAWTFVFRFLQRFSIFLATLLSVYRTIAISFPFYKVRRRAITWSMALYSLFLLAGDAVELHWARAKFFSTGPFCFTFPLQHHHQDGSSDWVTAAKTLLTLELCLPAIITLFSFIVGTIRLCKPRPELHPKRRGAVRYTRASVTVTLFTALFLSCNVPFILVMVLSTVTRFRGSLSFFSSPFMNQYSWLLAKILLTVANATLNPVLYYYRMEGYRKWMGDTGVLLMAKSHHRKHRRSRRNTTATNSYSRDFVGSDSSINASGVQPLMSSMRLDSNGVVRRQISAPMSVSFRMDVEPFPPRAQSLPVSFPLRSRSLERISVGTVSDPVSCCPQLKI